MGFGAYFFLRKLIPEGAYIDKIIEYVLIVLVFVIGIDMGLAITHLKKSRPDIGFILFPFLNMLFTAFSGIIFALLVSFPFKDSLLVHSGLGWYSLSSAILSYNGLVKLSIFAFIHNVTRELVTILLCPLMSKIHPHFPIFMGGATSMDVMLPFIKQYSGRDYTLLAFYSGSVCSLSVPFLIKAILAL